MLRSRAHTPEPGFGFDYASLLSRPSKYKDIPSFDLGLDFGSSQLVAKSASVSILFGVTFNFDTCHQLDHLTEVCRSEPQIRFGFNPFNFLFGREKRKMIPSRVLYSPYICRQEKINGVIHGRIEVACRKSSLNSSKSSDEHLKIIKIIEEAEENLELPYPKFPSRWLSRFDAWWRQRGN